MEAEDYLGGNRLFRRLKNGPHGELVERYARRLVEERLARKGTRQCLNVVGGLLDWIAKRRCMLANVDEHVVERYLRHRASRQSIQTGNRAALKRWLSVLRDEGAIAPAAPPRLTPHEQIFKEFEDYLGRERGLAPRSIIRHLPTIRRFLHEVCGAGADGLGKISQESVIGYIERHARDWSPSTGKTMCWSLRAFLRYIHHRGLNASAVIRDTAFRPPHPAARTSATAKTLAELGRDGFANACVSIACILAKRSLGGPLPITTWCHCTKPIVAGILTISCSRYY
jgi:site-specific recombinase XerD